MFPGELMKVGGELAVNRWKKEKHSLLKDRYLAD